MLDTLLMFALAELVFSLTPGPAVFLVLSQSIRYGTRSGLAVSTAIIIVNILFFFFSAVGIGAVLVSIPSIFLFIKIIGASYLLWMSAEILYSLKKVESNALSSNQDSKKPYLFDSFLKGFLMQASNAKNIVIFLAIIPQFINPKEDTFIQFINLGVVSVLVELPVLIFYTILASKYSNVIRSKGYNIYLEIFSAVVLFLIAISLLLQINL